jgi:hypothetical protein
LFAVLAKEVMLTISSMGGIQGSLKFAGLAAYSSSKGAVITLSELLAEEYKERGISFFLHWVPCKPKCWKKLFRLSSAYISEMKWQIIFMILL